MRHDRETRDGDDPYTGSPYGWSLTLDDGRRLPWSGLYTGPLALEALEIDEICRQLLGFGADEVSERVDDVLRPVTETQAQGSAVILHSTTPDLKTLDGEAHALSTGTKPGDATTYKEARSPYLARPGDLAVGRTRPWKASASAASGVSSVELPDRDHYYLSHALLRLAADHEKAPVAEIGRLVDYARASRPFVKLYALETEMQIFLLWLARAAGLEHLSTDANRPAISAAWNLKSVLHPTVATAKSLEGELAGLAAVEILRLESRHCGLAREMGIEVPTLPGYTIERKGRDIESFVRQLLDAAALLRQRYGLSLGCLKASESGDGARITPGLPLSDLAGLEELGRDAHRHGDDYLLEAHVDYLKASVAGEELPAAVSAHVRNSQVADGATLQFVEGTSWKGNLYVDEHTCADFQVDASRYGRIRGFMTDFVEAFQERSPGLVTGGIDFALGTVGGAFGEDVLLGVQDLNISFTGAECLRAFLDKAAVAMDGNGEHPYGVTRIYRPRAELGAFLDVTKEFCRGSLYADAIASIPGRWAMVGITGGSPAEAMEHLATLESALRDRDLVEA